MAQQALQGANQPVLGQQAHPAKFLYSPFTGKQAEYRTWRSLFYNHLAHLRLDEFVREERLGEEWFRPANPQAPTAAETARIAEEERVRVSIVNEIVAATTGLPRTMAMTAGNPRAVLARFNETSYHLLSHRFILCGNNSSLERWPLTRARRTSPSR